MTPALLDLPRHACHWPHGDPALDSFRWCAEPAMPGKSYCAAHQTRAYDECMSDDATDTHVIEDAGRAYRIVAARGRNIGSKRQWKVVPVGISEPARRSPASVVEGERYPTSPPTETRTSGARSGSSGDEGGGRP